MSLANLISFRVTSEIRPPLDEREVETDFHHRITAEDAEIDVCIAAGKDSMSAQWSIAVSDALVTALNDGIVFDGGELEDERRRVIFPLGRACDRVFELLVQEYFHFYAHRRHHDKCEWLRADGDWVEMKVKPEYDIAIWSHSIPSYKAGEAAHIQALLDSGEYGLAAYEYHRSARALNDIRIAWIMTTAAAELAVKEVLVRLEPKLSVLLFELPSPPLRKLYGRVLEDLTGSRSPFIKALEDGAKRRNELLHRPASAMPSGSEFRRYHRVVEEVMWDLLGRVRKGPLPPRY